jgi:hypothetical protein
MTASCGRASRPLTISGEQFLELAKKWMSDVENIDQGIELRPKEAAKASEMAGEENQMRSLHLSR